MSLRDIWRHIKARCQDPSDPRFPRYGGRGITLWHEWNSFEPFCSDVCATIGQRPTPLHTLDRIDNARGYEPGNIRWASRKEQTRNREATLFLEYNGQTRSLVEWSAITGIPYKALQVRVLNGWDAARAIETPYRSRAARLWLWPVCCPWLAANLTSNAPRLGTAFVGDTPRPVLVSSGGGTWGNGGREREEPVSFCPWCGAPIEALARP